jgi:hypothetical protein
MCSISADLVRRIAAFPDQIWQKVGISYPGLVG